MEALWLSVQVTDEKQLLDVSDLTNRRSETEIKLSSSSACQLPKLKLTAD